MESLRVVLVEPATSEPSLAATFAEGVECRATVATAEAAVEALAAEAPIDCVVVRHDPPTVDAVAVIERLRAERPGLAVVAAVTPDEVETVLPAEPTELLELGPDGRVAPGVVATRLRSAVDLAATHDDAGGADDIMTAVTDALPEYAFVLSAEGRYLDVLAGRRRGSEQFDAAELRGRTLEDVLSASAAATLQSGIADALGSGTVVERTYRLAAAEGDRWFEGRVSPLEGRYRGERAVLLVAREVTERRRREAEAAEARAALERTFDRISDAVFGLDEDWTVAYANDAGAAVLRGAMELPADAEVVGRHLWTEIPAAVDTPFYEHYHEAMATQTPVSFESQYEPLDAWFDVTAYPDPDGLSVFFTDVTERKRHEQTLNELLRASESLMAAASKETVADIISDAAAGILGYPANAVRLYDEATGLLDPVSTTDRTEELMGAREPYPPGDGITGRAFETGDPVYVPNGRELGEGPAYDEVGAVFAHPLGEHGVLTVGTTEPDAVGEDDRTLVALLAAIGETALDRADGERERRQLQRIIDHVGGQLFLLDGTDRISFVTAGFADAVGADRETLVGRRLDEVVEASADGPGYAAAVESVRRGETPTATVETVLDGGGTDHVELEFSAVGPAGPDAAVAGAMTDIRELASTREALASERDRFRELFEVLPVPVTEVRIEDGTSVVEFVNGAFGDVFGYDRETLRGVPLNDFVAPADGEAAALDERVAAGEELAVEVRRETVDGPRDFLLRASPYPHDGEVRAFGIYTDITAQRERERYLTILNRVLRHNFRNDLTVVIGFAGALADELDDPEQVAYAERVEAAGESLSALSETARELETLVGTRSERTVVDAAAQLQAALDECEGTADAAVSLDVADSLPVHAGERLEQAFVELIDNAIEHSTADQPELHVKTGYTADDRAAIRFIDNGPGIPDDEWNVIAGETEITQLQHGTGLGLWLVRWIVDSYSGTLSRSRNPSGSTVTLTFESAE